MRHARDLRVDEVMTRDPIVVQAGANLADAVEAMERHRVRHLPVMSGSRLVGLLSERNVRDALPSVLTLSDPAARRRSLAATRVERVWIEHPRVLDPSATVLHTIAVMRELRAGSIPILHHDRLVGIVTAGDLLAALESLLDAAP